MLYITVLKSEHAKGADLPIPKLPPALPPLSDIPLPFTKLLQFELSSLSEPSNPVVLKSLILNTSIYSLFINSCALSKNFFAFLSFCSFQKSLHLINASSNLPLSGMHSFVIFIFSNSTITALFSSLTASKEF